MTDEHHLDLETVAELDEGLLPSALAAAHTQHLAGCSICQARQESIRSTRALLAAMPPEPMPSTVGDRLDAALAGAPPTVVPMGTRRRRSWRSHPTVAGLSAAAAVVALAAAIVVGTTHKHGSNPGSASSTASGAAPLSVLQVPPPSASGTSYTAANFAGNIRTLVAPKPTSAEAQTRAGSTTATPTTAPKQIPTELSRLYGSPAALLDCIVGVEAGGPPLTPLAVDFARYAGLPAILVVVPDVNAQGTRTGKFATFVVGPGCSRANADVRFYQDVPPGG